MNDNCFSTPTRQSAKGVIVIFALNIYKHIKHSILIIVVFIINYIRKEGSMGFLNKKLLLAILVLLSVLFISAILKYLNFKFFVNQDYFILNQGVFNKEKTSIAKAKIQNVYIKQNLIQQIINVVSLSIETAGDEKTEIEIKALSKDKANLLKQDLLSQQKVVNNVNGVKEIEGSVYYKISTKKLILEGISENHFRSFFIILIFISTLYNDVKDFVESLRLFSDFTHLFDLEEKTIMRLVFYNITLIVVLVIVSFLFSLVKAVIQNFNLTVYKKESRFEISKGLINKINLGLVPSRIQTSTIVTNRFKEKIGLYQLVFTQAMVDKKNRQKFKIIGLSKFQITALIKQFYPNVFNENIKHKPNPFYIRVLFFTQLIPILILNLFFIFLPKEFFFINIPLIIFTLINVWFSYKKSFFSLDSKYLIVGAGKFISTTTDFLELCKIQGVELKQSIFQKRRGLASVNIYSASKKLTIPYVKEVDAKNIRDYLLYKVEFEDEKWM